MSRPYSQKFLMDLYASESELMGVRLAKVCVKSNLNTTHVAKVFGVTRATIHSWFRGSAMRNKHIATAEAFMRLVEKDLAAGTLPAPNSVVSKWYIDSMLEKAD